MTARAPVLFLWLVLAGCITSDHGQSRPAIRKLGSIDLDMVETTPVVWRGDVWRFEWVRQGITVALQKQIHASLSVQNRLFDRASEPKLLGSFLYSLLDSLVLNPATA